MGASDICNVGGVDATPPVAADAEAQIADYVRWNADCFDWSDDVLAVNCDRIFD